MYFLVIFAFILILASLAGALIFIMKDHSKSNRVVYALTARIVCSVLLFLLILWANQRGWIHSTGIPIWSR